MEYSELNKVADGILGKVKEYQEKQEEKKQLEMLSGKTILTNFDKFFTPEYEKWGRILQIIGDSVGGKASISAGDNSIGVELLFFAGVDFGVRFIFGECKYKESFVSVRRLLTDIMNTGIINNFGFYMDILKYFTAHFGTEERTIKTVSAFRSAVADMLGQFEKIVEDKNAGISEEVKNLKEMLEATSTVEEKDDGSIELHIGGKIYIGKVKEAENGDN